MRYGRELVVVVVLLVVLGALVRTGVGRLVLPIVALGVVASVVWLLTRTPAYSRTAVGPRTRLVDGPATDGTTCLECDEAATTVRRYVREWVLLGVPLVLLEDGTNHLCDDHLD